MPIDVHRDLDRVVPHLVTDVGQGLAVLDGAHDALTALVADPQRPELSGVVGHRDNGDALGVEHRAYVLQALPPIRPGLGHHLAAVHRQHVKRQEAGHAVAPARASRRDCIPSEPVSPHTSPSSTAWVMGHCASRGHARPSWVRSDRPAPDVRCDRPPAGYVNLCPLAVELRLGHIAWIAGGTGRGAWNTTSEE
jgi:hypothetical protein